MFLVFISFSVFSMYWFGRCRPVCCVLVQNCGGKQQRGWVVLPLYLVFFVLVAFRLITPSLLPFITTKSHTVGGEIYPWCSFTSSIRSAQSAMICGDSHLFCSARFVSTCLINFSLPHWFPRVTLTSCHAGADGVSHNTSSHWFPPLRWGNAHWL